MTESPTTRTRTGLLPGGVTHCLPWPMEMLSVPPPGTALAMLVVFEVRTVLA